MEKAFYNFYVMFVRKDLLSDLFKNNLLTPISLTIIVLVLGVTLLFYRNPFPFRLTFYKLQHWFLTMLIAGLIGFCIGFITCFNAANRKLIKIEGENGSEPVYFFSQGVGVFFQFGLSLLVVSCFLFTVYSLMLKDTVGSPLTKKTPL
jgi:hypothetical protein